MIIRLIAIPTYKQKGMMYSHLSLFLVLANEPMTTLSMKIIAEKSNAMLFGPRISYVATNPGINIPASFVAMTYSAPHTAKKM